MHHSPQNQCWEYFRFSQDRQKTRFQIYKVMNYWLDPISCCHVPIEILYESWKHRHCQMCFFPFFQQGLPMEIKGLNAAGGIVGSTSQTISKNLFEEMERNSILDIENISHSTCKMPANFIPACVIQQALYQFWVSWNQHEENSNGDDGWIPCWPSRWRWTAVIANAKNFRILITQTCIIPSVPNRWNFFPAEKFQSHESEKQSTPLSALLSFNSSWSTSFLQILLCWHRLVLANLPVWFLHNLHFISITVD